jgi:predicted AlkP superfamily phosphohydrolase/phosphomutase
VPPEDVRPLLDDLKAELMEIRHPETGGPLVERIYERDELYCGPLAHLAPDLTVVLGDWRYRTIGLYDFTTNAVISPAFGPTGDHRLEGVFVGSGPAFRPGATLGGDAILLDVAPTVLHLLGVPAPADLDGRVRAEVLAPTLAPPAPAGSSAPSPIPPPGDAPDAAAEGDGYTEEQEAVIQQRLADLGYL